MKTVTAEHLQLFLDLLTFGGSADLFAEEIAYEGGAKTLTYLFHLPATLFALVSARKGKNKDK